VVVAAADSTGELSMSEHVIRTSTHGRYVVECPEGSGPFLMLMGFHGYAESASIHMEQLRRLDPAHRCLRVSVQGLHRFYSRMQDVVASWMTREDRQLAIADNVAYALAVRDALATEYPCDGRIVVVGFSQGAAQAYRTALALGPACRGVVALGGDLPPDVASEAHRLPPVLIGRGRTDSWYPAERLAADVARLSEAGRDPDVCEFDGGHEWSDAFVARAVDWVSARR
jgi:predicted esterase